MAISNRYEFVMFFDVVNGNPNGDPDGGNAPRVDPEDGHGYVSDVCLKRKIRDYVELVKENEAGFYILIKPDKALNTKFKQAYEECGLKTGQKGKNKDDILSAQKYMCKNYYDVRAFGAVMSTGDDQCGTVRGPVQITFAKSVSPVMIHDVSITRQARTTEDRSQSGDTEMGRKSIIPYGLYRGEGYVSAALAQKVTDFNDEDLALLWQAIINMFEHDHSAARGKMTMRKLFVFKHENVLGNAPSGVLFDKISAIQKDENKPPRAFSDYEIEVDTNMPQGVTLIEEL